MSRKICYISGGMSGLPDYNFPAFNDCAAKLRADGWHVFNPAENFDGRTDLARNVYMTADFKHLLSVADDPGFETRGIVMLPGWTKSQGARVELAMALEMGLKVYAWQDDRPQETLHEAARDAITSHIAHTLPTASGETRITDPKTGGQKGQKDAQLSWLPFDSLAEVSKVYQYGARKYARDNWKKGYKWSLNFDAMMRHMFAFWEGEDADPESGLSHVGHACWHCLTLLWFMQHYKEGDDRAKSGNVQKVAEG